MAHSKSVIFGLALAAESAWQKTPDRDSLLGNPDGDLRCSVYQVQGHALCGTPGYIAPELYRADKATAQSDIYSFGVVLWQMAAGSPIPPFRVRWAGNIADYMRRLYERQTSSNVPRIEGPLGTVIARCLEPQASDRYNSFEELRSAFESLCEQRTGQRFELPHCDGQSVASWNNKGASLAALGQYEEAVRCYDMAIKIDPQSYKTWNNKGSALSALGRRDEAIHCFNRSLAIDPNFAMASRNLSREHLLKTLEGDL